MTSRRMLALAVQGAVFQSLLNAQTDAEREDFWFSHAEKMERKFISQFGMHYSLALEIS